MNKKYGVSLRSFKFSLVHILAFIAILCVCLSIIHAKQRNADLRREWQVLKTLSGRASNSSPNSISVNPLPIVGNHIRSWEIFVPSDRTYVLRFGYGQFADDGLPESSKVSPINAGRHRVTLLEDVHSRDVQRYAVYLDGEIVFDERNVGSELPNSSGSFSANWPDFSKGQPAVDASAPGQTTSNLNSSPTAVQLESKLYLPHYNFPSNHGFRALYHRNLIRQGFRLWLDDEEAVYPVATPFMHGEMTMSGGLGLKNGIRFRNTSLARNYRWNIFRPRFESEDSLFGLEPVFYDEEGRELRLANSNFQFWVSSTTRDSKTPNSWDSNAEPRVRSMFLHAKTNSPTSFEPVIEVQWDSNRLDEVAFRLADSPKNDQIKRWELKLFGGSEQLWRQIRFQNQPYQSPTQVIELAKEQNVGSDNASVRNQQPGQSITDEFIALPSTSEVSSEENESSTTIEWQTPETLPLSIVQRTQPNYSSIKLYGGLPVAFSVQIPEQLNPGVAVKILENDPSMPTADYPGGAVFEQIQLGMDASREDWVTFKASLKEMPVSE